MKFNLFRNRFTKIKGSMLITLSMLLFLMAGASSLSVHAQRATEETSVGKVDSPSNNITFETYSLKGIGSIEIPSTMELKSGAVRSFLDQYMATVLEIDSSGIVLFGNKGPTRADVEGSTFATTVIVKDRNDSAERPSRFKSDRTAKFLRLDRERREGMKALFAKGNIPGFMNQQLKEWYGSKLKTVNGVKTIYFSYLRQLNDQPSVFVQSYIFERDGQVLILTLSYRKIHEERWRPLLERVRDSFITKEVKVASSTSN